MKPRHTVICAIGTRPEANNMVPMIHALYAQAWANARVLTTAQHRDMHDQ
jgi:UDP-N-acetylglucosamine 2-epimerase (non-hydrolysing)